MKIEKYTPTKEKNVELTVEQLERFLEVKISQGTTWQTIVRNIESGAFLRFIVTDNFDIYLGTSIHDGIREDNGIDANDCLIDNGSFHENDDGRIQFIYYINKVTPIHVAAEKKIIRFFKDKGINLRTL